MTYLKLMSNAIWAGLYGAALVVVLLFYLNEDLAAQGILSVLGARALISVALIYVPVIAWTLPTLFVCVRFFAARRLGTPWLGLKPVVWFGTITLGALTVAYYRNLYETTSLLPPPTRESLRLVCATMAGCCLGALCCAGIGQFRIGAAGRIWRQAAAAFLLVPLAVAPAAIPRRDLLSPVGRATVGSAGGPAGGVGAGQGTLLLVGLEAASMDQILPLISSREIPTFERLAREGASARLDTVRPCVSRVAWTALATGAAPWANGVRDTRVHSLPLGPEDITVLPHSLGLRLLERAGVLGSAPLQEGWRRSPTIGEILRSSGEEVELIGWDADAVVGDAARQRVEGSRIEARVQRILGGTGPRPNGSAARLTVLREAVSADLAILDLAREGARGHSGRRPRLRAIKFSGLGRVSRYFLRYHVPDKFGDVTQQERDAYGRVILGYYQFLDDLLAEQIGAAGPGARVLVTSAYGVEPLPAWETFLRAHFPRLWSEGSIPSGGWGRSPDGVLLLRGEGVRAGRKIDEADLLDVVPTALYGLGMPIGRDMRGDLLRRVFEPDYLETHPVHYIPAYARSDLGAPGRDS